MTYYDAHTHLNDDKLYQDRQWYIQEFVDAGWLWLVNVWVDKEWSQRAIDIASQAKEIFPDSYIKATIGYHPSEVCFGKIANTQDITKAMQSLQDLYTKHEEYIVAIGEWWIDTHYDGDPYIDIQKELFAQQCDLAQELNLPIVIHSRDDFASTRDVVKNYKNQKIYFHCRGYGPDELKKLQDYFSQLWIGYCGNISYPKAQLLRDSLYATRPESVVLETDAPYLAPQKYRGKINKPLYVIDIYTYVASITGTDPIILKQSIADNVRRLYNIQ